jgi:hypothetical protein
MKYPEKTERNRVLQAIRNRKARSKNTGSITGLLMDF